MSRSSPVCLLFCAKCKKASANHNRRHYDRDAPRDYLDVRVIGRDGDKARCRCGRCGYEYSSGSRAAIRRLHQRERIVARCAQHPQPPPPQPGGGA